LDAAETGRFRDSWKQGPAQRYKLQKVLKLFFNWACDRRLIDDNPTAKLSQIKVKLRKTEPFTQPQMRAILRAVSDYPGDPETIRAQVLLLRYTGLRGEDAAWLRVDAVEGDHITVDTGKTDEMVRIFAPAAAAALRSIRPKTADSTSGPARAPKRRLARSSTSG
jgi:site-specific recombinase XerD